MAIKQKDDCQRVCFTYNHLYAHHCYWSTQTSWLLRWLDQEHKVLLTSHTASTWTIDRVKWTLNSGLTHTVSFPPLATRWVLARFWHGSGMRRNPTCCSWGVSVSLELSQEFWKENLIVLKNRETVNALGTRQSWASVRKQKRGRQPGFFFSKCRFGEKSGVLLSS